ncbi:HlyD family secretion protein [Nodosilinea nodulosa]|uniref:HlyD family secretion protein n=1 Tax=Nodosilinea nodulosa TaxID=416001 RepID=UPI0002D6E18E|nr:HlyD family secretion protein [Nodosilinea nodulosa]
MELDRSAHDNQTLDGHKPPALDGKLPAVAAAVEPPVPLAKPPQARRKWLLVVLLALGLTAGGIFGYRWWRFASVHESTDDAYVTTDIHPINARIEGTVISVEVQDNQQVAPGTVLVHLDPRDYEVARQQSQAALEVARHQADVAQANIGVVATTAQGQTTSALGNIDAAEASISTLEAALAEAQAGVPVAQANLAKVEADLANAKLNFDRYTELVQQGALPQQQLDAAKATYNALLAQQTALQEQIRQAQARVVQAQKSLDNAQGKLQATQGTLQQAQAGAQQTEASRRQYQSALAAIAQSEAELKNADLQLSYTAIAAPMAGRIGNKTVQVGQRVQPGQTLMSVVQPTPWIVANFKETQLEHMRPGQPVDIEIDAFPNHRFTGTVDSIAPASGADFALLPPDNATGNFTKIVRRIPVKIVFNAASIRGYETLITSGMSVITTVETK